MKSVEKQIEAKIAELEKEVVRFQAALGLIRGAKHTIVADSVDFIEAKKLAPIPYRSIKRGPRGPYKKKRKNAARCTSKCEN